MQIMLHWTIAALVVLQLLLGEDIKPAYRAFSRSTEPAAADLFNANLHVYVGLAVLLLAIWRFAIRSATRRSGRAARGKRCVETDRGRPFPAVFSFMPITGRWHGTSAFGMGEIHELAKPVVIIVVGLHAAAALWQHFYLKSDVLVRMLRPAARRTP